MSRIRIFVSFDDQHDADLCDQLHEESTRAGSRFECSARSQNQNGATDEAWVATARTRIRAADEVVVICGEHTDESLRVAAELRIVHEEEKPYMLLWGRREKMCTKPVGARPSDAMYSWTRPILESQISAALRASRSIEVPQSVKRHAR